MKKFYLAGALLLLLSSCGEVPTGMTPGDHLTKDTLQAYLPLILGVVLIVLIAKPIYRRREYFISRWKQLISWGERQDVVFRASLAPHSKASEQRYWQIEQETVARLLRDRTLVARDRQSHERVLERLNIELDSLRGPSAWWKLWNLPAPSTFVVFQVYLTPWGHTRRRHQALQRGELGDLLQFTDGTSIRMGGQNYKDAVKVCNDAGWTMDFVRTRLGSFPKRLRKFVGDGTPEEFMRTIYDAGEACVVDMRGPDDRPGAPLSPFANNAARLEAMRRRAETLVGYFRDSASLQGPFDMGWTRVVAALGQIVAMFSQMREIGRLHPDARLWDMRFSVHDQSRLAFDIQKKLMQASQNHRHREDLFAMAAQFAWMSGAFDSLIWYRGQDNWKQLAAPVMQEAPVVMATDSKNTPPQLSAEQAIARYGLRTMPPWQDQLYTLATYDDLDGPEVAEERELLRAGKWHGGPAPKGGVLSRLTGERPPSNIWGRQR